MMQWSALCVSALLLLACGCTGQERQRPAARRLPPPITATREGNWDAARRATPAPPPAAAIAPKPAQPAPVSSSGWTPSGGIRPGRWKVIVVHHAASDQATPAGMDSYHRKQRGWENGLGYHFVIGNGIGYPDGAVYVGPRWKKQIQGAHCRTGKGKYFGVQRPSGFFNDHGIGICLIGDMQKRSPTRKQLATLHQLITFLTGKTGIARSSVYGHGEVTRGTLCPGRNFSVAGVRRALGQAASADDFADRVLAALEADADFAAAAHAQHDCAALLCDDAQETFDVAQLYFADALDDIAGAEAGVAGGAVGDDVVNHQAGSVFVADGCGLHGAVVEPQPAPDHRPARE